MPGQTVPLSELAVRERAVGIKQVRKAVREGRAEIVFLACDANPALTGPVEKACGQRGVPVVTDHTMGQIGRACRIAVGASAAAVLS